MSQSTPTPDYRDPANAAVIAKQLIDARQNDEIENLIRDTFPGWLKGSTHEYSDDYEYLQRNWKAMCQRLNIHPEKIVIVDEITFDEDHKLLMMFCEKMTQRGYVVRRANELQGCSVCRAALPSEELWRILKQKKLPVPEYWSAKCSGC